jgi:hypothetical protein
MNKLFISSIFSFFLVVLSGCTASTHLSSVQSDVTIDIEDAEKSGNPRTESFYVTTFGNYNFRIKDKDGREFFGILPLKFNGGYLTLDILFFAPFAFLNLREVYPFYEFDIEKSLVKYKRDQEGAWFSVTPSAAQASGAKAYFSDKKD